VVHGSTGWLVFFGLFVFFVFVKFSSMGLYSFGLVIIDTKFGCGVGSPYKGNVSGSGSMARHNARLRRPVHPSEIDAMVAQRADQQEEHCSGISRAYLIIARDMDQRKPSCPRRPSYLGVPKLTHCVPVIGN
jgi:hypothetical protein